MPRTATLDDLDRLVLTVRVPVLWDAVGEEGGTVRVRRLSQREYFACLPALPAGAETWTPATAEAAKQAWVAGLSDEQRADLLLAEAQSTYRIVAAGLVDAVWTWREVARLGTDADVVALAILKLSKWIVEPATNGTPAEPAADAP